MPPTMNDPIIERFRYTILYNTTCEDCEFFPLLRFLLECNIRRLLSFFQYSVEQKMNGSISHILKLRFNVAAIFSVAVKALRTN